MLLSWEIPTLQPYSLHPSKHRDIRKHTSFSKNVHFLTDSIF